MRARRCRCCGSAPGAPGLAGCGQDRKSTRLNSSHGYISYAVFCLKKKNNSALTTRSSSSFLALPVSISPEICARVVDSDFVGDQADCCVHALHFSSDGSFYVCVLV